MGSDDITTKLSQLDLKADDGAKQYMNQLFKNPEELKENEGLNRLIKLLEQPKNANILYERMIDEVELTINQLRILGDTNGSILVNILQASAVDSKMKQHVLDVLKNGIKGDNVKFYLRVYLNVISTFDQYNVQHLNVMLPILNPTTDAEVQPLIILIAIGLLKHDRIITAEMVSEYLDTNFNIEGEDLSVQQYLNYIKILEVFFPLIPETIAPIYLESSKRHIKYQISKIKSSQDITLYRQLVIETLNLFSASCINNQCREFNYTNYFQIMLLANKVEDEEIKVMANLIIIKLWNFLKTQQDISKDTLTNNLLDYIARYKTGDDKVLLENAIEGLAYLSLNNDVKSLIRINESVLDTFMTVLTNDASSPLKYGLLVIFKNACKLKDPNESQDKKTVNYLKSVSTPKPNNNNQESQQDILLFSKSLLIDRKIISVISQMKVQEASTNNLMDLIISIIYLISTNNDKAVKIELVRQGALKLIMNYLIKNSHVVKQTGETRPLKAEDDERLSGIRALAKILYSISPELAFNNFDVRSTIPFLIELLGPNVSNYTGSISGDGYLTNKVTMVDKFESLLALTNISSSNNSELKKFIISKTFNNYLDNLILDSDHPQVQIASWELISNLISEPTLLVKFFNVDGSAETKKNGKRLDLLIKLLDSQSEELQIVLGGLLANATSQSMICQVLLNLDSVRPNLLEKLTTIFENQSNNNQLVLRVSYVLSNLVYFALNANELSKLNDKALLSSIKHTLSITKDAETREILQDSLQYFK